MTAVPKKHIFHLLWISSLPVLFTLLFIIISNATVVSFDKQVLSTTDSVKDPILGLLDRKGAPTSGAYLDSVNAHVVNAYWKDLQTSNGGAIKSNNVIDQAISKTRTYNNSANKPQSLKLRLFAGIHAPAWAKTLAGGPYKAYTGSGSSEVYEGEIGYFWTNTYQNAYENFLAKIAAKYDNEPLIKDVTTSMCTTVYAEPMIIQISSSTTRSNLINAGYTYAAHKNCHYRQIDIQEKHWKKTRSSLAFNPVQGVNANKTAIKDMNFTHTLIDYCRNKLGNRCVLENNSLRCRQLVGGVWKNSCPNNDPSESLGSSYKAMYDHIIRLGPPIAFQTAAPPRIGNWRRTLEWAAEIGANAVELNSSYSTSYSPSVLSTVDSNLESNSFPIDAPPPDDDGGGSGGGIINPPPENPGVPGGDTPPANPNGDTIYLPAKVVEKDSAQTTIEKATNPVAKIVAISGAALTETKEFAKSPVAYVENAVINDDGGNLVFMIGSIIMSVLLFGTGLFVLYRFHNAGAFKTVGRMFKIKPNNFKDPEFHRDPPKIIYPTDKR